MTTRTTTEEIPRGEWRAFFDYFSRSHEGWLVTLEVNGDDFGAKREAEAMRFGGASADLKDGDCAVTIMLGDAPDRHVSHTIARPERVRLERTALEAGDFETLEIEGGGVTTLVRFLAGVVPE